MSSSSDRGRSGPGSRTPGGRSAGAAVLLSLLLLAGAARAADFSWLRGATLVGLCGYQSRAEAAEQMARAAADGASVVDIHAGLTGTYENFNAPDSALAMISFLAEEGHKRGVKVICYIAGLEIISKEGEHTALKDHPNWAQRDREGNPALFDDKAAFWIAPGEEDIWLSPFAEDWLAPYLEIVGRLAASGVDGVYMDIPYWMTHFEGWGDTWASFDDATVAEFRRRTGLDPFEAKLGDFSDSTFRAWVRFRMDAIDEFVTRVRDRVKETNPEVAFIVELYPGVDMDPVVVGADPYRIVELCDVIAHEYNPFETSAARGTHEWARYQAGLLALRAFAGTRPSWMLTYAARDDWPGDQVAASANLAFSHLAAGASFWECGGLRMCGTTVEEEWRARALGWIRAHADLYYPEETFHDGGYALYFSPQSRTWAGEEAVDAFLGAGMLFLEAGVPYTVVTPKTLAETRAKVLILPDVRVLSGAERAALRALAKGGVTVVATGRTGSLNEQLGESKPPGGVLWIAGSPEREWLRGLALTEEWEEPREPAPAVDLRRWKETWWAAMPKLPLAAQGVRVRSAGVVQVTACRGAGGWTIHLFNTTGLEAGEVVEATPLAGVRVSVPGVNFTGARMLEPFGGWTNLEMTTADGVTTVVLPELGRGATLRLAAEEREGG